MKSNKLQLHILISQNLFINLNKLSFYLGRSKSDLIRESIVLLFEKYHNILGELDEKKS